MKTNLTEIVFILDRSGSMKHLTSDTIGGFNSFIDEQKKVDGEALLTTILFDDEYEILHNGVNLKVVKPLTTNEYSVRGFTALLDAIGKTINEVGDRLSKTKEEERPSKVIFIITTDGEENSSKEFKQEQVKSMIENQTNNYNWQFIFLGANIDAVATAQRYGINANLAHTYTANSVGTQSLYTSVSKGVGGERGVQGPEGPQGFRGNWAEDIK